MEFVKNLRSSVVQKLDSFQGSEPEKKVKHATSNENWGTSNTLKNKTEDATQLPESEKKEAIGELGLTSFTYIDPINGQDKYATVFIILSQVNVTFDRHTGLVNVVEYSPFVVDNIEIGCNSNVICSGSDDNTIRFWDIRSNMSELYLFNGDKKEDNGIMCFKFVSLKKKRENNEQKSSGCC
ncbi:hypothetical protein RFI_34121, partial [Reticulomyxa filosa]